MLLHASSDSQHSSHLADPDIQAQLLADPVSISSLEAVGDHRAEAGCHCWLGTLGHSGGSPDQDHVLLLQEEREAGLPKSGCRAGPVFAEILLIKDLL